MGWWLWARDLCSMMYENDVMMTVWTAWQLQSRSAKQRLHSEFSLSLSVSPQVILYHQEVVHTGWKHSFTHGCSHSPFSWWRLTLVHYNPVICWDQHTTLCSVLCPCDGYEGCPDDTLLANQVVVCCTRIGLHIGANQQQETFQQKGEKKRTTAVDNQSSWIIREVSLYVFQGETRCTGPHLGTRTVVQFWTMYVNHAESEFSACFETRISVHFVRFRLRIFEVRTTHAMKPWKFPEIGQKRQRRWVDSADQSRDRSW